MLSLSVKEFHKSHLAKLEGKVEWYVFADAMYSLQITFSIGLPEYRETPQMQVWQRL